MREPLLSLPCGSNFPIQLTRRATGGHTSSAFSGTHTVSPVRSLLSKNPFLPLIHVFAICIIIFPSNGCVDSPHHYIKPSSSSFSTFARAASLLLLCNFSLAPITSSAQPLSLPSPLSPLMPPRARLTRHSTPE